MTRPILTDARAPLTRSVEVVNAHGERESISIPAERALTVYVDKRELVTLMTLGAAPEALVLGYLRNQRLVESPAAVESVTVDWDVGAAAVKTRCGMNFRTSLSCLNGSGYPRKERLDPTLRFSAFC